MAESRRKILKLCFEKKKDKKQKKIMRLNLSVLGLKTFKPNLALLSARRNRSPKGNMWSAIPVALL